MQWALWRGLRWFLRRLLLGRGGLTLNAVRLEAAASRLRNPDHLRRPAATVAARHTLSTPGFSQ
jgi:hypothetical protein